MSRITADVIDVMENEKTRVEILDIAGKDPEKLIGLYRHEVTFNKQITIEGQTRFRNYRITLYSHIKDKARTVDDVFKLLGTELSHASRQYQVFSINEPIIATISFSNFSSGKVITVRCYGEYGDTTPTATYTTADEEHPLTIDDVVYEV